MSYSASLSWSNGPHNHSAALVHALSPGDLMRAELTLSSLGWKVLLSDASIGWASTTSVPVGNADSALWIQIVPPGPTPETTRVRFTNIEVNGKHPGYLSVNTYCSANGVTQFIPSYPEHMVSSFSILTYTEIGRHYQGPRCLPNAEY